MVAAVLETSLGLAQDHARECIEVLVEAAPIWCCLKQVIGVFIKYGRFSHLHFEICFCVLIIIIYALKCVHVSHANSGPSIHRVFVGARAGSAFLVRDGRACYRRPGHDRSRPEELLFVKARLQRFISVLFLFIYSVCICIYRDAGQKLNL